MCYTFSKKLAVTYFKNLMPMISSDSDNAPGTVYYAVALTGVATVGCFLPDVMVPSALVLCVRRCGMDLQASPVSL